MKAPKSVFACTECGAQSQKWLGRCPDCGAWNTLGQFSVPAAARTGAPLAAPAGTVPGEIRTLGEIDLAEGQGKAAK